ncbi:hypothetical protein [Lentibacillus sp. CBA3610]|nr:hypothetical protein [Lentibacillus sp. CBA3610]
MVGPAIAGALLVVMSAGAIIWLTAVSFLVSVVIMLFLAHYCSRAGHPGI